MQKDRRKLRKQGAEMLTIGYAIYEVLASVSQVVVRALLDFLKRHSPGFGEAHEALHQGQPQIFCGLRQSIRQHPSPVHTMKISGQPVESYFSAGVWMAEWRISFW